jgi:hydroxymethylglutaryl-CoA lyase
VKKVILEDETLRDGLQLEEKVLSLEEKVDIFNLLVDAGVKRIQVGSFVHPKIVPQMADTEELIRLTLKTPGVLITGLILNGKGLERALRCGLHHVSMSVSASDTHSRKNANLPSADALAEMTGLIRRATDAGLTVRAGVQCTFGCVYEGEIPEDKVISTFKALASSGAKELNLADTAGMANPIQIRRMVQRVKEVLPEQDLSLHLHDTRGLGLANMFAGYEAGVTIFDAATGGLGGCPFVKGATGNVPMEDAVNMFSQISVDAGIDLEKLCILVDRLEKTLERKLPGRMSHVFKNRGDTCR